jgi:hypothetical protein
MRFLRILALVALCLAYAPTPAMAVTGYDSAYSGESAFVTISPGQTLQFQVFFSNTGTLTWTKGGDTQVDLAACLADKVTCNAQDTSESSWNSGWLSTTRYTTTTQATVAPGALATFAYNIKAPSDATAGLRRFNGDLVVASSGARIHPEGYYQDAEVQAAGSVPAPSPTPTPTATPGSTPFPSAPPATPTATPPVNFTISPWAYACGDTVYANPAVANDTPGGTSPNGTGTCPTTQLYGPEPRGPEVAGTSAASYSAGTLNLSKGGALYDDLSSGATIGGITHLTSASFDVAGYCGAGAPRLSVWTDSNGNGEWDDADTPHAFGCSANNQDGHVNLDLSAAGNGYGTGGVSPEDLVVRMNFVFDEVGTTAMSNIKFNGMSQ